MERGVEMMAAVSFLVVGLSHIFRPTAWAEHFIRLREMGQAGNFLNATHSLVVGSIIVSFHNVWDGWPAVLTLLGWTMVLKATVYFLAPRVGMRALERIRLDRARMFVAPGVLLVAISGGLTWMLATG